MPRGGTSPGLPYKRSSLITVKLLSFFKSLPCNDINLASIYRPLYLEHTEIYRNVAEGDTFLETTRRHFLRQFGDIYETTRRHIYS